MSKKWLVGLVVILVICLGLHWVKIFPDPFHKEESVDLWTWIYRELHELIYGEKPVEEEEKPCNG